jgi:hypothetical protein
MTRTRYLSWRMVSLILVLLFGCGRSEGQPGVAEKEVNPPTKKPNTADLVAITAPAYRSSDGVRQECLGRLVFEVGGDVQWPTFYAGDIDNFPRGFSPRVFNTSDIMRFGNNQIAVLLAQNSERGESIKGDLPSVSLGQYEKLILEAKMLLEKVKGEKSPSKNHISNLEDSIENWIAAISEIKLETFPFDPGVPGGEGYGRTEAHGGSRVDNYSIYRAYITHGKYIYVFESTRALGGKLNKEDHAKEFSAFLKNFRPRAENEVPSELGVCIPHGFIRDDGKTLSDIKQSYRYPDALGVLYTIHTGSYENSRGSTALKSLSFASVGTMGTAEDEEVQPFVTERLGPRAYKIGGISGLQGGVAVKMAETGSTPYETYQVFTGYSGWPGAEALPFIFVELNTTTMNMAPELKENPPPFKQSMGRYEALLKSIRLRPTTPLMPDLLGNVGK